MTQMEVTNKDLSDGRPCDNAGDIHAMQRN